MNILEEIILYKKIEVAERKKDWSVDRLEKSRYYAEPVFSLRDALLEPGATGVIAEYKRRSPSKGVINEDAAVEEVTRAYAEHGATGLSVLTDEKFFGGCLPDLLKARINSLPVLRKDFMIDEYQLIAAKSFGADQVLLIAACLTKSRLRALAAFAKSIGLETILEVHSEHELDYISDDIDMVGVNNRNLKNFEVNIDTSLALIGKIPAGKPAISESGIDNVATIRSLKEAGYKGFLIGEKFMRAKNPGKAFEEFINELNSGAG